MKLKHFSLLRKATLAIALLFVMIEAMGQATISGNTGFCMRDTDQSAEYRVSGLPAASSYEWHAPFGATITGSGTAVYITFSAQNAVSGTIAAVAINNGSPVGIAYLDITISRAVGQAGPISGTTSICKGSSYEYSIDPVANAIGYAWAMPWGATITSQNMNKITVFYSQDAVNGNIIGYGYGTVCGMGGISTLPITILTNMPLPSPAGAITGANKVYAGQTNVNYSVPVIGNATTGYQWTLPAGASIVSGVNTSTITVNFASSFTGGNISVAGINCSGTGPASASLISTLPSPATFIDGNGGLCITSSGATGTYTVSPAIPNATSYVWSVSTGTIRSPQNGQTITVDFPSTTTAVNVTVYGVNVAGNGASFTKTLTIFKGAAAADAITGPGAVALGQTSVDYSVSLIANATTYVWTLPAGATLVSQQNNAIKVNFSNTFTGGAISVFGTGCAQGTPASLNISAQPGPAGVITGNFSLCITSLGATGTYTVPSIINATSYVWNVSAGTIRSPQNGQTITVDFPSTTTAANVTVYGSNAAGNGASAAKALEIIRRADDAGAITGPGSVSPGQMAVSYSVASIANATNYVWTLPAGVTLVTQNGNAIKVDFSDAYTGGTISVYGVGCAPGAASSVNIILDRLLKQNNVRSDVVKVRGVTTDLQMTQDKLQSNISYMDGLGRPFQRLAVQASGGTGKDLVEVLQYDKYGMQPVQYLPYVSNGTSAKYQASALSDQKAFYATPGDKVADDNAPYAVTVYDNSPLFRVAESGAPGADWQPGKQTVKNTLKLNAKEDNIRIWTASGPSSAYYETSELSINELKDENGNLVITYANMLGQLVLKKVQATASVWHQTVFIYDDMGKLVCQVSPEGVKGIEAGTDSWTTSFMDKWALSYTYDSKGRLVEKKAPGAAPVYMVYDKLDRLVLTQDGNLRTASSANGRWYFTKYDMIHRPVMSGIYPYADPFPALTGLTPREKLQKYLDELVYDHTTVFYYEQRVAATTYGYSNQSFPASITDANVLAVSYYDDYDFDNNGTADYTYLDPNGSGFTGAPTASFVHTEGLPTGSRKKALGTTGWIIETVFYDEFGNLIQKRSNNLLNQAVQDATSNVYDTWAGKVLATKQVKQTSSTAIVTVVNKMAYDEADRLTEITSRINGGVDQVVARYEYNELGQLVDKKLHGLTNDIPQGSIRYGDVINSSAYDNYDYYVADNEIILADEFEFASTESKSFTAMIKSSLVPPGNNFLQSIDFRYNIRGWLTSINNSTLTADGGETNDDANDVFGMSLLYNTADAGLGNVKYYNGKLSAVKWQVNDVNSNNNPKRERSYSFEYDKQDRLLNAFFKARGTTAWDKEVGAYDEKNITYDHNGNIKTLRRYALLNGAAASTKIDDLSYTHAGNKLTKVEDAGTLAEGFKNNSNLEEEYLYDTDGNLINDKNKGATITYNDLGKTSKIDMGGGKYIQYAYDASGVRIKKEVYNNSATPSAVTVYVEGFVYENSVISYFPMAEGRIKNTSGATPAFDYEYCLTDHQGNVRASFVNNGGTAKVVQENHFYPFGLTMPGQINNTPQPSGANKEIYNGGSELQTEFEISYYSTYFREYDPVLGRFNGMDPMVDKYGGWTPYNYAFNDPVNMNDPMGDDANNNTPTGPPGGSAWMDEALWRENFGSYDRMGSAHLYGDYQMMEQFTNQSWRRLDARGFGSPIPRSEYASALSSMSSGGFRIGEGDGSEGHWGVMPREFVGMWEGQVLDRARPDLREWIPGSGNDEGFNWIDALQLGLDVIGMTEVPILSQGAELISAGISFGRGDVSGGLIGLGSMIPFAGKVFEGMKVVRKVAKTGEKIYEIADGVRRAKAASMLGHKTIKAMTHAGDIIDVPIANLRSPLKSFIDVSTSLNLKRFDRIYDGLKNGDNLPPIYISPGNKGISIFDVIFKTY